MLLSIVSKQEFVGNGTKHMTSLEIAELTGKQHKNVMQAIRNMEPAWEKVNGLKFQLVEYKRNWNFRNRSAGNSSVCRNRRRFWQWPTRL